MKVHSAPVVEFSLRLVLPFTFPVVRVRESLLEPLTRLTLAAAATELPVPPELLKRLGKKQADGNGAVVWEHNDKTTRPVSRDLHPHIRRLLRPDAQTASHGCQLTLAAWQMLDGGFGDFGTGLELALSQSGCGRLGLDWEPGNPPWLPFSFRTGLSTLNPPRLHLLGSGIGVLELEVSPRASFLKKHGPVGVQEFIHAIARLGSDASVIRWSGSQSSSNLETILAALLPGLTAGTASSPPIERLVSDRLFSFACLRTATINARNDAEALAQTLAHRQTAHYLGTANPRSQGFYAPFENIVYAMSTEGGSVVIGTAEVDKQPVEFFQRFIGDRVKGAYWPMVLLAYMEFLKLVRLTGDVCRDVDFQNPQDKDYELLDAFRTDILNFRLNYRFSQASQMAHHNDYYTAWREMFGSDRLLQELTADVEEVDEYLDYKLEKTRMRIEKMNRCLYEKIGIIVSAFLFLFSLFSASLPGMKDLTWSDPFVWGTTVVVLGTAMVFILYRQRNERAADKRDD